MSTTRGDEPAYPTPPTLGKSGSQINAGARGLSKREMFAVELLAALGTWTPGFQTALVERDGSPSRDAMQARAAFAVAQADALLAELERAR